MNSFKTYLSLSLDNISSDLINTRNKEKLLMISSHLPDMFARFLFGYEKCLNDTQGKMDISVSAPDKDERHSFFSCFDFPELHKFACSDKKWNRIRTFSETWHVSNNILNKLVDMIALEFDFISFRRKVPIPAVFLGMETVPVWPHPEYRKNLYERLNAVITGIEILSGDKMTSEVDTILKEITKRSLNKFHIFQAGIMLSRTNSPIKVCLRRFNSQDILKRTEGLIEDQILLEELEFIIKKYSVYFDELVLALDITRSGIQKAGVECYYKHKRQPSSEERWNDILSRLISDGFCNKDIAESLLKFPKKHLMGSNNVDVPEYYAQGLHHLKMSAGAQKKSFAKIYLWSGFHWKNN